MAPFDQPQTSTPIKVVRKEERRLEVTVEAVEAVADKVRKDTMKKIQMPNFKFFAARTKSVITRIKVFVLVSGTSSCGL